MSNKISTYANAVPVLSDYALGDQASGPTTKTFLYSDIMGLLRNTCNGRLTLTSGTAITTADVATSTSVYFTPYLGSNIAIYNGTKWLMYTFTELTLALGTITSALPYDVFIYDNSGTLTLELLAWTNGTTRATALVLQDGIYCKTGALTRRYLGSFRTISTTQTTDTYRQRFLFNLYNQVPRPLEVHDTTNLTWSYATDGYRQADAVATNQVEILNGLVGPSFLDLTLNATPSVTNSIAGQSSIAIGENSTTTPHSKCHIGAWYVDNNPGSPGIDGRNALTSFLRIPAPLGYNYYAWLESGNGSGTITWDGTRTSGTIDFVSGLAGYITC